MSRFSEKYAYGIVVYDLQIHIANHYSSPWESVSEVEFRANFTTSEEAKVFAEKLEAMVKGNESA